MTESLMSNCGSVNSSNTAQLTQPKEKGKTQTLTAQDEKSTNNNSALRHGKSETLAWCAGRPFMASVIFGATTAAQLAHIIAGKDIELSDQVLADLNKTHRAKDFFPYDSPTFKSSISVRNFFFVGGCPSEAAPPAPSWIQLGPKFPAPVLRRIASNERGPRRG